MKRIVLCILALFLVFTNSSVLAAQNYTKKELKTVSADGFNIISTFVYPKVQQQKEFSTVVLLHSLGYNSGWWGSLEQELLNQGFAVLSIDLRGHGKSIYNSKLAKVSWKDLKNSAYAKYPEDVLAVINNIKEENTKRIFFNNWAIVGADIGASAGVLVSDKIETKPTAIVMISPVVETKGLYIPVSVAHLDDVDFLTIAGTGDSEAVKAQNYLKKFAQKDFTCYTSPSKSSGMIMLKNDAELSTLISQWLKEYLD